MKNLRDKWKSFLSENKLIMKEHGIITCVFLSLFYILKFFPPQCILEERVVHQIKISGLSEEKKEEEIWHRMRNTEFILIFFVVVYIVLYCCNNCLWIPKCLAIGLITLRLIDIIQVNVNVLIFDNIRLKLKNEDEKGKDSKGVKNDKEAENGKQVADSEDEKNEVEVASVERVILLALWGFFEMAIIFGFYYSLNDNTLFLGNSEIKSIVQFDYFYFSFITQLTIGYGDFLPTEGYRWLTITQGVLGQFLMVIIIARIVGSMPNIKKI